MMEPGLAPSIGFMETDTSLVVVDPLVELRTCKNKPIHQLVTQFFLYMLLDVRNLTD